MRVADFKHVQKGETVYVNNVPYRISTKGRYNNPVTKKLEFGALLQGYPISEHVCCKDMTLKPVEQPRKLKKL